MSERSVSPFEAEVRETVVKFGLTGATATLIAATVFSPAGLGGMIGSSFASGDPNSSGSNDVYASLPAFPAPLSQPELLEIRGDLARTTAALEITRAATADRVEHLRSLASSNASFADVGPALPPPQLRLRLSEPEAPTAVASVADRSVPLAPPLRTASFRPVDAPLVTPIDAAPLEAPALAPLVLTEPVALTHLELANLMFSGDEA